MSNRFGSKLNLLAVEMGGKGGEESGNTPALRQIVQARLPPILARISRVILE